MFQKLEFEVKKNKYEYHFNILLSFGFALNFEESLRCDHLITGT